VAVLDELVKKIGKRWLYTKGVTIYKIIQKKHRIQQTEHTYRTRKNI
jgi:hypothetical protein